MKSRKTNSITLAKKSLSLAALLLTLVGCSTIGQINDNIFNKFRSFYTNKPELSSRQPKHLMPHKKQLFLKGPVKKITYSITRPDFSNIQTTNKVHITFNRAGFITEITGDSKVLRINDLLKYWNLPPNTKIEYDKNNVLKKISNAKKNHLYEYEGGPETFNKKTGNMRSVILNHIVNSERKYRTLDYMIYAGNRYMVLSKDNRKREKTVARIYEFTKDRLHKLYIHEDDYPLDKNPILALQDPLEHNFILKKLISYDLQDRINYVMTSQQKGARTSEEHISYHINSKNPKYLTNINGLGLQQYRIQYSDYKPDPHNNWVSRKVVISDQGNNKEGNDIRKIKYFKSKN